MARAPISARRGVTYTPSRGPLAGQTFTTEREYRNARARVKGFASLGQEQRNAKAVRTPAELARLKPSEREARDRALYAVSKMRREGLLLKEAARDSGTTVNAMKKYAGPALEKSPSGRWQPRKRDSLLRPMRVLTTHGERELLIRDSRTATTIAEHWIAVREYISKGRAGGLRKFWKKAIHVEKRGYLLETDTAVLDRLARAGVLSFESIYSDAA